jgi:hypothetical protein
MTCIQCGRMIPNRLSTCPNCGRPAETVPGLPTNHPGRPPSGRHLFTLDARRWTQNDRIVAGASAIVMVSLFLPWFGISFLGANVAVDALISHNYFYIVLIICIAILGYLVLRMSPLRAALPGPRIHDRLLLAATAANFVIVLIGFISTPGGTLGGAFLNREYGAFVGGIAALVAVLPLAATLFNFNS